jgi:ABC-type transporter MlaC component
MARAGALDEMTLEAGSRPQRPYVAIGAIILTLVFVAVGAAFLLNKQLRPQVGIEPVAGVSGRTMSGREDVEKLASSLEKQIATAYLNYWSVYGAAMENRDTSHLAEVTAGDRLQQATTEVEELKSQGIAAKIQVRHSFSITQVADKEATIQDSYLNASYAVDPQTRAPVGEPGKSQQVVNTYSMARINGAWKVTDVVRETTP